MARAANPANLAFRLRGESPTTGRGIAMLHYLWIAIIGFVVGLLARAFHPGKDSMGMVLTAILGIAGSFLATYVGQFLGWYKAGENAGFFMSVIGAIVLLVIYGLVAKRSGDTQQGEQSK